MSKLLSMREAVAELVPDGASVAMGCQMEQMIPFAAGHEIMRQKKRGLTLVGPISDILFDQLIGAGCVEKVVAAWVGNVMMGSAYNFRRAVEGEQVKVFNMTNFTIALALQAGAMGVPFLPTRSAMGSDVPKGNHFFYQIFSPFEGKEPLLAVRALNPDVAIVHVQRADAEGNAHASAGLRTRPRAQRYGELRDVRSHAGKLSIDSPHQGIELFPRWQSIGLCLEAVEAPGHQYPADAGNHQEQHRVGHAREVHSFLLRVRGKDSVG